MLVLTLLCLQLSLTIKFLDDVDDLAILGLAMYALDNERVMTKKIAITMFDDVIILIWENYEECTDIFQRCSSLRVSNNLKEDRLVAATPLEPFELS